MNNAEKSTMNNFIELAKFGHYPLFFDEWLRHDINERQELTIRNAKTNLNDTFKKLARHRTIAKKKTALISLKDDERQLFIQSFLKMVEFNTLKEVKSLH